MVSTLHEAICALFENRPELAAELLRTALQLEVPAFTKARVEPGDLSELAPPEYRADVVSILYDGEEAVAAFIVEVQLRADPKKRWSWPSYVAGIHARHRCPTYLLVITIDSGVAQRCAQPIELGHPGFSLRPLVLGPEALPVVTDIEVARRAPEVAVLSVLAHGRGEHGLSIAHAVLKGVAGLPEELQNLYTDLTIDSVNDAARAALETMMRQGYEYRSNFARQYFGEGQREGLREGLLKARRTDVLIFLEARGLDTPATIRERIEACSDLDELERLVRRAAIVKTADELFE